MFQVKVKYRNLFSLRGLIARDDPLFAVAQWIEHLNFGCNILTSEYIFL